MGTGSGRRIAELIELQTEIGAWSDKTNAKQRGVDWQFRIENARTKLKRYVKGRTDHLREAGINVLARQLLADCLGDAEVNHLDHGNAIVRSHQDVRRLEIAVDDAFTVGVLHRLADH